MKKETVVFYAGVAVVLLAAIVFVVYARSGMRGILPLRNPQVVQEAIDEVNANANFPFPLATPEAELDTEGYERAEGMGGYALRKFGIWLSIAGWPDVQDSYHVKEYRFTVPDYQVFGFTIGDRYEDAAATLEQHGYRVLDSEYDWHTVSYTKDDAVDIELQFDKNTRLLNEIWVTAVATNKDNVVF